MYEPNYNFFFKINNRLLEYILFFLIIILFLFNTSGVFGQNTDPSLNISSMQSMSSGNASISNPQDSEDSDSNLPLEDNELPESDITTKIYRSTDNVNEALNGIDSELDPALDIDVLNKEDLINMHSKFRRKVINRGKIKNEANVKKTSNNLWLPWILFTVILGLLAVLIKVIRKIKI